MAERCSCADCNEQTPCAAKLRRIAEYVEEHERVAGDDADITVSLHGDGDVHLDIHYQ